MFEKIATPHITLEFPLQCLNFHKLKYIHMKIYSPLQKYFFLFRNKQKKKCHCFKKHMLN